MNKVFLLFAITLNVFFREDGKFSDYPKKEKELQEELAI
jgi:hypothetical protein